MMKINSFNPVAAAYSRKVTPYRAYQYYSLIHELALTGNEKILDIGSGPGELSLQIASQLNREGFLLGIDLSPNMVRLARRSAVQNRIPNVAFKKGDALNMEFEDNSFDVVTSSNAFPWVPDRARFLREVNRVLKPGGKFALAALSTKCYREFSAALKKVTETHLPNLPQSNPFYLVGARLHTVEELAQLVEKNGLTVQRQYEVLTEEPISPTAYLDRVNAIINENYLEYASSKKKQREISEQLLSTLSQKNGSLKITEAVVLISAVK